MTTPWYGRQPKYTLDELTRFLRELREDDDPKVVENQYEAEVEQLVRRLRRGRQRKDAPSVGE